MYLYITHMLIQVVGVLTSWALQFVPYFCSSQCKLQGATGSCDLAHGQGSDFTPAVMRQEPRGTKGDALQHFWDWISAIFQPMPSWFLLISAVLPLWAPRAELSPSPRLQEKIGYLAEEVGLHWQSEMSLRSALAFHIIPLILDTCWRRESL